MVLLEEHRRSPNVTSIQGAKHFKADSMSNAEVRSPRIAIIGAGPFGCTLARLLVKANVWTTIFESDAKPSFQDEGGTLDLHNGGGIAALKKAGLFDVFLKHARVDGDAMNVCDKHLRQWLRLPSSTDSSWFGQGKPENDRSSLRELLTASLPEGTIRWGRRLKSFDAASKTMNFSDGSIETGYDLVVGAEGAWSKVREAVSDIRPFYTGVGGLTAPVLDPERRVPEVYQLVNRGSWFNFGDGSMILGQQMGGGSLYVTVWRVMPEDWQKNAHYDIHSGTQVRSALGQMYQDWSPQVRGMLGAIDPNSFIARNLYMLPVDFEWESTSGVTLIGDSSHLMSPFTGSGVNEAMHDALELSEAIVGADSNLDILDRDVRRFEREMNARVTRVQLQTRDMMELTLFTRGAPETTIERWIVRGLSNDMNDLMLMMVRFVVFVVYFIYRRVLAVI